MLAQKSELLPAFDPLAAVHGVDVLSGCGRAGEPEVGIVSPPDIERIPI